MLGSSGTRCGLVLFGRHCIFSWRRSILLRFLFFPSAVLIFLGVRVVCLDVGVDVGVQILSLDWIQIHERSTNTIHRVG